MTRHELTGRPVSRRGTARAWTFALAACMALAIALPSPALAHPPSSVVLAYDAQKQVLSVTITHTTLFKSMHYIKTVELSKNGKPVQNAAYTSQPTGDTFTYIYTVAAAPGDELSAKASCSLMGSGEGTASIPK